MADEIGRELERLFGREAPRASRRGRWLSESDIERMLERSAERAAERLMKQLIEGMAGRMERGEASLSQAGNGLLPSLLPTATTLLGQLVARALPGSSRKRVVTSSRDSDRSQEADRAFRQSRGQAEAELAEMARRGQRNL